jgi:hypothetical protein
LSYSTGQPHPLAKQPVIFIDKKTLPLNRWTTEIEIVGDFIILLVSFSKWSRNQDIIFFVRWKTGLTHCVSVPGRLQIRPPSLIICVQLGSPENGTYHHFSALSQDTLVIPNLIQNTFEITRIVIDNDDTPHFVLLCVLHLPPPIPGVSLFHLYCCAQPNPTGSGSPAIPFRSDRPFHDKAEDAIVIFYLSYEVPLAERDWLTLIVHRSALLTHIPAGHRTCAPFCSAPEPMTARVEVPWSVWGPPSTRLFIWNPSPMHYIAATSGQRAVMLEGRIPTPITVRDFNPYAVRAARALASANGKSLQGNWSKRLPNGNRMSLIVKDSMLPAGSIFGENVWSSLPYVEIVTGGEYRYDGVMMDDERILCFKVRFKSLCR